MSISDEASGPKNSKPFLHRPQAWQARPSPSTLPTTPAILSLASRSLPPSWPPLYATACREHKEGPSCHFGKHHDADADAATLALPSPSLVSASSPIDKRRLGVPLILTVTGRFTVQPFANGGSR
ncbi:hypothetical protein BDN71DRAFT_1511870 [Pleurotus eryngii]|uniref:Uncharacterized protein n=1 Tax=Pleurotus eryngii TaxID=5323 RepID=A0A9P5ZME8_PLEER|nr:hypothetical protein BDN71DRAFT_1511870 [Pleurotus eryngii]